MPFSHHSHSGQFCGHATNTLAEMVATAVSKRMTVFAMTEHMPRNNDELYPEELESGHDAKKLAEIFEDYVREAERLRKEHSQRHTDLSKEGAATELLIGFEAEWIRPAESAAMVHQLMEKHNLEYFIGSIHHVRTIPIDYNKELFDKAQDACGGTEEQLFHDYFDSQHEMLQALKPKIVGHFDLIRLLSDKPDRNWKIIDGGKIWAKITRNLQYVIEQGSLLEINTSALRKGLEEPYPRSEICEAFIKMGGSFVLSDDSHAVDHVATNYAKLPAFLKKLELDKVCYLSHGEDGNIVTKSIDMHRLLNHPFWAT